MSGAQVEVRAVEPGDRARWDELYAGYAEFYGVAQDDAMRQTVWDWIQDESHEVGGLVALLDGEVIGMANYRPFAQPLLATTGGFLDDLFVDPAHRGSGAADALLAKLASMATERGWSVVRWITADNNYRGRGKYDQHATRTTWVTYDMAPQ